MGHQNPHVDDRRACAGSVFIVHLRCAVYIPPGRHPGILQRLRARSIRRQSWRIAVHGIRASETIPLQIETIQQICEEEGGRYG